jgi:hypothetical protein
MIPPKPSSVESGVLRAVCHMCARRLAGFRRAAGPQCSGPAAAHDSVGGRRVCGQSVLMSPSHYDDTPGRHPSGTGGLPTYGVPGSDFPRATGGMVLPAGQRSYSSYQLRPRTVYYLLPDTHVGTLMADAHDAFLGGFSRVKASVLSGDYVNGMNWAIDSNSTDGDQSDVAIEYLTIQELRQESG